ncbi:MAG: ATP-binding protein [Candidatus Shapirobacteria bacterium]|nr:ATP-binding protein [Candidatus Shapirobacteria bacterium]MDD4410178.1 ATP-binding protein [Candidatus Shapirobacteria bacterium]
MKLFNKKTPVVNNPTPVDPNKRDFTAGLVTTKDIIAPSSLEVDFNHIRIDNKYYRTLFVAAYPRFVGINWLSSLINFDSSLNISMFVYPTDGKEVLDDLRRKITEMEAELSTDIQRGRLVNPGTQAKLEDALNLQANLVKGEERFFQFGLYITITADTVAELDRTNKNLEAALGSLLIVSKRATLQMEDGFVTTLPICQDKLSISRNMDTTSLATTFPFVSSDLSDDRGIMYGINMHNGSLVIFDRFSMPNYNSVVFATAGAGKSYLIKLEVLRSLMMGTEIIVIDPENEYRELCVNSGGQYIAFGYGEGSKINPFDLTLAEEAGENGLNTKILSLHKLLKVMLGEMDPIEESIMDRAMMDTYKMKGITPDPTTQDKEPPLIEDLYKSLIGMEDEKAKSLAARLEKYIKGSFSGIFNQKTTVQLNNKFVVFGIKNLEDVLRPVAMQIILDYIWTVVKKTLKKRILVVDEAWYLMQHDDSAEFLRGIVKRGRKYYLGVTTITQDVDDFLETAYGKEIVTNSSIQILLKQHSAAIDQIGEVFYLSQGEKQLLLSANKGEGIFFAGQNHVAIKVIASEDEHNLITSNPEDVLRKQNILNNSKPDNGFKAPIKPIQNPSVFKPTLSSPFPPKVDEENGGLQSLPKTPIEEIKKPEFTPKINIPEIKTVEIENKISEPIKITEEVKTQTQPEIKNESVLFKKPEVVVIQNPSVPTGVGTALLNKREPLKLEINKSVEIKVEEVKNEIKRPIFIKNEEEHIPQPPQLNKNPQPIFETKKPDDPNKMDYDKLFGDGIV